FLAEWLVDNFEVVRFEDHSAEYRMDIWLDEKRIVPEQFAEHEVISYGFTPESEVQDFPVRGKAVFLHLRRRKWQETRTGKVVSRSFEITHRGTRLTRELVAFLKATNRE
ncbi:MAG: hypothetical protein LBR57_00085, partial [Alistipes sp.]|nr:hypothetical protein [Alistipes sp.]